MSSRRQAERPPAPGILRRATEILKQEGLLALWFRVLGEIFYRRVLVMERSLAEPVPHLEARRAVRMRWLREEEAAACARSYPGLSEAEVVRRLRLGHRCLVAEAEGRIVHATWVASSEACIEYLKLDFPLASGQAYLYQSYTTPEMRGQNLGTAGLAAVLRCLRQEGFQRAFCCLQPDRAIAYPPPLKTGFVPVARLGWFRLGPRRRVFRRPVNRLPWWGRRVLRVGPRYWDVVGRGCAARRTLDPFLGAMKRRAHLGLIRRWGGVPERGRVLKTDVFEEADGAGQLLRALRRPENVVVGMDISPVICARAAGRDAGRVCSYAVSDVRRLPFAAGAFALIVSTSTLDHFTAREHLGTSLRELRRVLARGGRLIITLDNRRNLFYPLLRLADRLRLTPYFLGHGYTVDELRRELRAAGFDVLDSTAILHGPRLVPFFSVALARLLGWRWLQRRVRRGLLGAQRLGRTRWAHQTGSFVAALAEVRK